MFEYYSSLSILDKAFLLCAVLGGSLFVVRLVLTFVAGGDHDSVGDTDIDVDADTGAESAHSFKILTIQGITGFFMMFGLVGLAISESTEWKSLAVVGAFAAGSGTVWVLDRTFRLMKGLQSSGTLSTDLAIGKEGSVYLTVPAEGVGKVQVSVDGRLREFNAVSEGKQEIKTGERIRVVRVVDGGTLSVERIA